MFLKEKLTKDNREPRGKDVWALIRHESYLRSIEEEKIQGKIGGTDLDEVI